MSNLQIIEALCQTIEIYAEVMRKLVGKLEIINALDDADKAAVARALEKYSEILGAGEAPDMEEEI